MKRLSILLLLPLVIGLSAPVLRAGEDGAASSSLGEVLARLSTDDPASMAWGAYLSGRDGHRQAIPPILDLLRSHVEPHEKAWHLAHRSALDALIRLDARVSPALLARHERRLPIHVLILRARDPLAHTEALLERFQSAVKGQHVGHTGLATGNLLLKVRPQGFVALLLSGTCFELKVRVYTPGPDGLGGGSGSRTFAGSGDGMARVPEGFPPYVWYQLMRRPVRGGVLLADGPHPVFYERRERARSGLAVGGPSCRLATMDACVSWIGALLGGTSPDPAIKKTDAVWVGWTTAEAYVERVTAGRAKLLAPYWATAKRLVEAQLLSREEAREIEPHVVVKVQDDRTDQTDPIPALPAPSRPDWLELGAGD